MPFERVHPCKLGATVFTNVLLRRLRAVSGNGAMGSRIVTPQLVHTPKRQIALFATKRRRQSEMLLAVDPQVGLNETTLSVSRARTPGLATPPRLSQTHPALKDEPAHVTNPLALTASSVRRPAFRGRRVVIVEMVRIVSVYRFLFDLCGGAFWPRLASSGFAERFALRWHRCRAVLGV
jgi:hypothetical protein